jgi:LysW-gamma-L-lysine carboxypeptidase
MPTADVSSEPWADGSISTLARPDPGATQALHTLHRMVLIESPSGREGDLAVYLAGRAMELGYDADVDEAGNLVASIGTPGAPVVMLLGHLDTVPGQVPVRYDGDRLFGRGTVDAKGSLAAMLHAGVRAAAATAGRITVVGAADEEGMSRGARHLLSYMYPPAALVIGEPSGAGNVVIGYKGILRVRYRVTRPPHHTSGPVENAVQVAAALWEEIRDLLPQSPGKRDFDRVVPALVRLDGDCETASAEIVCRTPAGFSSADVLGLLSGRLDAGAVTVIEDVPAVRTRRTDPVVRALSAAVRQHVGEPVTKVKLGTSDMNVLVPRWGPPVAAYGPGDSHLDHTADEHIDLREYLLAIDVLTTALPEIARTCGRQTEGDRT